MYLVSGGGREVASATAAKGGEVPNSRAGRKRDGSFSLLPAELRTLRSL